MENEKNFQVIYLIFISWCNKLASTPTTQTKCTLFFMDPQKYIGSSLRIKTVDGRLLDGVLTVIDPFGNLLLSNVKETSQDRLNTSKLRERELGLVSVPRDRIISVMQDKKQVTV